MAKGDELDAEKDEYNNKADTWVGNILKVNPVGRLEKRGYGTDVLVAMASNELATMVHNSQIANEIVGS